MSKSKRDTQNQSNAEHGTVKSYIIGYALSLLLTAIPFYLVLNQSVTETSLLLAIMVFAFLQMGVQLFFFLHLGRGSKPLYNVGFYMGTFGAILVVVVGSIWIMGHLRYNMASTEKIVKLAEDEGIHQINGEKTGACRGPHTNHKITIKDGLATPAYVSARQCDTISFIKEDDADRIITFGSHPQHKSYAGETELKLRKDRANTITLNLTGTYQFHDHLNPATAGYFIVVSR